MTLSLGMCSDFKPYLADVLRQTCAKLAPKFPYSVSTVARDVDALFIKKHVPARSTSSRVLPPETMHTCVYIHAPMRACTYAYAHGCAQVCLLAGAIQIPCRLKVNMRACTVLRILHQSMRVQTSICTNVDINIDQHEGRSQPEPVGTA